MARLTVGTFNIGASADLTVVGPTREPFVNKLRADVHMLMEVRPCSIRFVRCVRYRIIISRLVRANIRGGKQNGFAMAVVALADCRGSACSQATDVFGIQECSSAWQQVLMDIVQERTLAATQGALAATQGPVWDLVTFQIARLAIVWNTSKLEKENVAQHKVFPDIRDADNKRRNLRHYLQACHPYIGTQ